MHPNLLKFTAGVCIIGAILAYGFGNGLVESALNAPLPASSALYGGAALMWLNSVFVLIIGTTVFRLTRAGYPAAARIYLVARILEALLLAIGVYCLTATAQGHTPALWQQRNFVLYNLGMAALGIGSVLLFYSLRSSDFLPRWLLLWGMTGYTGLLLGAVTDLFGHKLGIWFAIPGGLFELIWGGLWVALIRLRG